MLGISELLELKYDEISIINKDTIDIVKVIQINKDNYLRIDKEILSNINIPKEYGELIIQLVMIYNNVTDVIDGTKIGYNIKIPNFDTLSDNIIINTTFSDNICNGVSDDFNFNNEISRTKSKTSKGILLPKLKMVLKSVEINLAEGTLTV